MNPWQHRDRYPHMPFGSRRNNLIAFSVLIAFAILLQVIR